MLARFGLGFKIPIKPLIIQLFIACLFLSLMNGVKAHGRWGEFVKNGGIETGDMTGWEAGANDGSASNTYAHNGTYSFVLNGHDKGEEQRFDIPYPCKEDITIFQFWVYASSALSGTRFQLIFYNQTSEAVQYTSVIFLYEEDSVWIRQNITTWGIFIDIPDNFNIVGIKAINGGTSSDGSATYWDDFTCYVPPPFSVIDQYTWFGIFMGGIVLMVWSPAWVAWKIKKKGIDVDTLERIGYAFLIWLIGLGLFISYIYH